jgi:hypothetical protein
VATVVFQGKVLAFARATPEQAPGTLSVPDGVASDIVFNVLALELQSGNDALDWSGFRKLEFPNGVRPAGMNIVNVPLEYGHDTPLAGLEDAGMPFKVLSNQEYVYLFRQAKKGTLLVNRFRLVRATAPGNPQDVQFGLDPAWEVRFQRSGKPDTPYDSKDVQSYLDPDDRPFIEPAFELFMVGGLVDGNFDVEFLPSGDAGRLACQVMVLDAANRRIDGYHLPLDNQGLFDLAGKSFGANHGIAPDSSFQLVDGAHKALALHGLPSLAFYVKQERVAIGGASFTVKRSGRLMLALAVQAAGEARTLATVDFAVSSDGTLATPPQALPCAPVGVANHTFDFDASAHVRFDPVALPSAGYAIDFWLYPENKDIARQLILGNPGLPTAPQVALLEGTRIQTGFTGLNGQPLVCTTQADAVRQQQWSRVRVSFDPADKQQRLKVLVNGTPVACSLQGTGDKPDASPLTSVSATLDGFIGNIDNLCLYDTPAPTPKTLPVQEWAFDTIDYTDAEGQPLEPPLTPNAADAAHPAQVFGAALVPSTSPTSTGDAGHVHWDARNLSVYCARFAGLGDFGELKSSPMLLDGSDGLLHCYFQGRSDEFCAMQFDAEVARAGFDAAWHSITGPAQSGTLSFAAAQFGTAMNDSRIRVADAAADKASAAAHFCNIELVSPTGRTEHWQGVPRTLAAFAGVLDGASLADPADLRLLNGRSTYFDVTGQRQAAYLVLPDSPSAALLAFVTRYAGRLPLSAVDIAAGAGAGVDVTLRFKVTRWNGFDYLQHWQGVPAAAEGFVQTLNGLSPAYDYQAPEGANTNAYSLSASSGLPASNKLVLLTHPELSKLLKLSVAAEDDPLLCTVNLSAATAQGTLSATWARVPRLQEDLAATLEGGRAGYDYAKYASGDHAALGKLLLVTTDGNQALVDDVVLGGIGKVEPDRSLRLGASLFCCFVTAPVASAQTVPTTPKPVPASAFQQAWFEGDAARGQGAERETLTQGSTLFGVEPGAGPAGGSVAQLQNGDAALTRLGTNGGWINQAAQRTLAFDCNWVGFATDQAAAPGIGALAMPGDMSLELWCKPERSRRNPLSPNQRLLTFARDTPTEQGMSTVRYLAGLRDCPSLACAKDTTVATYCPSDDGTFYAWLSARAGADGKAATGVVGSVSSGGIVEPILVVEVNADRRLQMRFARDKATAPLPGKAAIDAGRWYQVAVPYTVTSQPVGSEIEYRFAVSFYVDGALQGAGVYTTRVPDEMPLELASLVVGDIVAAPENTLPMQINEVAFFDRALADAEISRFFGQRIAPNADGLACKWMMLEGDGTLARNSAATGSGFDAQIRPTALWATDGLYFRPVLGHGDNVAVLRDQPVLPGWSHLAMVHQAGYALRLDGAQFADAGNSADLEISDRFAIECWVEAGADARRSPQTILAKGEDYELWLGDDLKPRFQFKAKLKDDEQLFSLRSDTAVRRGQACHLVVNYEQKSVRVTEGDKQLPRYELHLELYLNGQRVAWGIRSDSDPKGYKRFEDAVEPVPSSAPLNFGRTSRFGGARHLAGHVADVRLWNRTLSAAEIVQVFQSHREPANTEGLVSAWHFNQTGGRTAFDSAGNNNARLSDGAGMVEFKPTASNAFFVDGQAASPTFDDGAASAGGYGSADQFLFGQVLSDERDIGFCGKLDEVRIWNRQLTQEQISDSMNRTLAGSESGLAGYWSLDSGSGAAVDDRTGRGNSGRLGAAEGAELPRWTTSHAPLGNEAAAVFNILGGIPTTAIEDISGPPSVVEYADLQRDAYGSLFSVMKRAYVSVSDGRIALRTGYKVGDLDTVYLGQAQSKPSLIGFIEGAPPIPSENQTLPYWAEGPTAANSYAGASSVQFEEADNTVYAYNAERDVGDTHAFSLKGGLYAANEITQSSGIGVEVETPVLKFEGHLGAQFKFELANHATQGIGVQNGSTRTFDSGLKPGGSWEPGTDPQEWVNATVGRRYVPDNTGCALVKSLTVDVYASVLKSTGSMVTMSMVPNPDIPEDVNIIDFPINPRYVKNGTLDGMVGLKTDPDYRNANGKRGSYFKPLEAYALKRRIEREEQSLEAYYRQYDAGQYGNKLVSDSGWEDHRAKLTANPAYDWSEHLSKRNIVNTYVWTAGGGLYAERLVPMNVYSESHGAIASRSFSGGAVGDFQIAFPVAGPYVDFDYLYTASTQVNVVKSKQQGTSFSVDATAQPDPHLQAPRVAADGRVTMTAAPVEGKVDGYRYDAFWLAPHASHYQRFFTQVLDPVWFNTSMDPGAVALREASSAKNGVWSLMYRVTYVSRIPPAFQPVPDETPVPDTAPPVNAEYNVLMLKLVKSCIKVAAPTPLQIGQAVAEVLGTPQAPGLLKGLLPWWTAFLADSTDYKLPAARLLAELREDLLRYTVDSYAAEHEAALA